MEFIHSSYTDMIALPYVIDLCINTACFRDTCSRTPLRTMGLGTIPESERLDFSCSTKSRSGLTVPALCRSRYLGARCPVWSLW